MGMSQTPIIQALKWLEFQQLVCHVPNRGYYTAQISLREVEEIYDFREMIELSLLMKTMNGLNDAAISKLECALNAHIAATREVYLYDRLVKDMEFHLTLASLAGCRVQEKALQNLFDLLYLKYGGSILFSTSMELAASNHRALFEHIRSKSSEKAGMILAGHIHEVKKHVLKGLTRNIEEKKLSTV